MDTVWQDVRHAFRLIGRYRGHAAASALTLALGVGVNAALFSVADAVLLRPLPYPEPERLVDVRAANPRRGIDRGAISPADFLAWRAGAGSFAQMGAYVPFGTLDLTGAGEPVRLNRHMVSAGLLAALGVRPAAGRLFAPEEYREVGRRAVLLSHRLWRERFGGDPGVVGRTLTLGGEPWEVAGVLPRELRVPGGEPDLIVPLVFPPGAESDRGSAYLGAIGRLRPGATLEGAQAELAAVAARLERAHPESNEGLGASLLPLREAFVRTARPALLVLSGAVALVLLLACVDAAGLELARAAAREREMAVRAALGAGGGRLVRQLLTEGAALGLLGGALGLPLSVLALRFLPDPRGLYLPRGVDLGPGPRVLAFAALLALLSGLASALAPALRTLRPRRRDLQEMLRTAGAGAGGPRRRLQDLLVVPEVALALTLLAGAGLALQGFAGLLREDPGFEPAGLLTFEVALPAARYPEATQAVAFFGELAGRLAAAPGVAAAGGAKELPPQEPWAFEPEVEGLELPDGASAGWQVVSAGYFEAMGTPVLRGRGFTAADRAGSPRVMIASAAAARDLLGDDPVGRRVSFNGEWHEVVGVVAGQKAPGAAPEPVFYVPHAQVPVPADFLRTMTFAVRAEGDPLAVAGAVRSAVWSLDRDLPVSQLQTMDERLAASLTYARPRFHTALLALFAGLALALAAVGIYGVLSQLVGQRTRELGVRLALGARRGDLERMVLGKGAVLALTGLVLGLPGAWALGKLLASRLPAVGAPDLPALAAVAAALLAVALLACWLPARRAGRLDPVAALRRE